MANLNIIDSVVAYMQENGVLEVFNEYPGLVRWTGPKGQEFWAGTVNETWGVDLQDSDGCVLDSCQTDVPSGSTDVPAIATAILEAAAILAGAASRTEGVR